MQFVYLCVATSPVNMEDIKKLLLTKKVNIVLNSSNVKHYENLYYLIPRKEDKRGRITLPVGSKITVMVEDLPKSSNVRVEVKCDCENCKNPYLNPITWQTYNKCIKEDGKYYCNKCANKLYGKEKSKNTKIKNGKSFEQWCIENNRQDVLNRWDYDLNKYKPSEINHGTKKKYYFKCPRGLHKSELNGINNFISGYEGIMDCNQCNSFAQWGIDNLGEDFLEKYWDYKKNTVDPWEISYGSKNKIWIKCQKKDYHDSYDISPLNFKNNYRCPECKKEKYESILQEKTRIYLNSLNSNILHERNCNIKCINPKTKKLLPYDNEIEELKLVIEVHGKQHYEITGFHYLSAKHNDTTPEYELYYIKIKDRYKRMFAKSQGYFYLEIPYWTDDKDETWKKLINDKIKYIEEENKVA